MRSKLLALALYLGMHASVAGAAPAQILLIRHGEKPPTGPELNDKGRARAQALVAFFENSPAMTQYGVPVAIYAMNPDKPGGSVRAIQTVTPLADSLGIGIENEFTRNQVPDLVHSVMTNPAYSGRTVLICWEHSVIPQIVDQLGWTQGPQTWDGAVFDRAWVLNLTGDQVTSFQDLPEHVLPGDSDH